MPWRVARASVRLEEIRASFLTAGGFGELARRHSEAENAARGGAVAASTRGSLLEEYEEVAWQLEPGEVSRPVRLPAGNGHHLARTTASSQGAVARRSAQRHR